MSSEQQGVCLSRPQFVSLYHTHLEPSPTEQDGALDAFARMVLNRHCREYQLSVVDNYPSQPRPHDLIPRDLDRLNSWSGHYGFRISCVRAVTPKANGLEAFFVSHRYGYAVVQRNGVVRSRRWNVQQQHVYSVILEGEVVGNNIFVAYDCLATSALFGLQTLYIHGRVWLPTEAYAQQGRMETRHAALRAVVRRLHLPLCVRMHTHTHNARSEVPLMTTDDLRLQCKPFFPVEPNPHRALEHCLEWARRSGIPCDGVVFVDAVQTGPVLCPGPGNSLDIWRRPVCGS